MCATLGRDASAGRSRAHGFYAFEGPAGRALWWRSRPGRRFGRRIAADGDRQRRHPHHQLPPHPPEGRHHRHLQGERQIRPGRPQEDQSRAARLAHRQPHRHGPAPDRRPLGGLSGYRRQGADPRDRRLPFAGHQRHASPPLLGRRQVQPAHARQGDRLLHPGRQPRIDPRRRPARAARRRRLLSVLRRPLRPHGRRQRAPLAAGAGSAARAHHVDQGSDHPPRVQHAGGAEEPEGPAGRRRLAQHA